jgi:arginyl-tRNA synthetase
MIAAHLDGVLHAAASHAFGAPVVTPFTVERPRDPALGDVATNLPLVLAKALGRSPMALAEALVAALEPDAAIASVRAAAPGFLNIRFRDAWLAEQLRFGVLHGVRLPNAGHGRAVVATYTAPPPGRMRPADARQVVWGDVLARLLRATGHRVTVRHVVPAAWAALPATEREAATDALALAMAAVGVAVNGWEAAGPTEVNASGWTFKKTGMAADHDFTGMAASMTVSPAEAGVSLGPMLAALGADGFRWLALSRAQHLPLTIDLAAHARETLDNPLFLIPYTHARLAAIERLARQGGLELFEGVPSWTAMERTQLLRLLSYPDVVADAAEAGAPHRLTRYLEELVAGFHQVDARHRIFGQPSCEARGRLGLVRATRLVLAHGMGELLGMTPLEHLD